MIIGVHAPGFQFEHKLGKVQQAVTDYGISWPVVQAGIRERGDARRLEGCQWLASMWQRADAIPRSKDPGHIAEQLWLLTSAENYFNCVNGLGWSPDEYETWLKSTLETVLFD